MLQVLLPGQHTLTTLLIVRRGNLLPLCRQFVDLLAHLPPCFLRPFAPLLGAVGCLSCRRTGCRSICGLHRLRHCRHIRSFHERTAHSSHGHGFARNHGGVRLPLLQQVLCHALCFGTVFAFFCHIVIYLE